MAILRESEFWILIAFLIALGVLIWKAWPIAIKTLDSRSARIRAELDEAARLRDEARRTLAEYQHKQRDALKEAEQIVAQARREAERAAQAAERDLAAALERRQRQAIEKIALAEARARDEVRNVAVDIAIAAVRRLLAEELDPARKAALIDEAITDLSQRMN
jgi:F-type H+-transporting ATPase subunit b